MFKRSMTLVGLIGLLGLFSSGMAMAADDLAQGFAAPPDSARPRVYWWWLNSHVTRAGITRDLEEMKAKGIRGALVFDAGGEAGPMPAGPKFMGKEWRELLKHAVKEADRLGIEDQLEPLQRLGCRRAMGYAGTRLPEGRLV